MTEHRHIGAGIAQIYDCADSIQRLAQRFGDWTRAGTDTWSDTLPRLPEASRPALTLDDDPGVLHRTPEFVAGQFERLLAQAPIVVEDWAPFPGTFCFQLNEHLRAVWTGDEIAQFLRPDDYPLGSRDVTGVAVGSPGHFIPDVSLGLREGWDGSIKRAETALNAADSDDARDYLHAVLRVVRAARAFIQRHAEHAKHLADAPDTHPDARARLLHQAQATETILHAPPRTFHEHCLWLCYFMALNRSYNGQNSLGALDELLAAPFERDIQTGFITEDEACFLLQALLFYDTHFISLGGCTASGTPRSTTLQRLILRAWRKVHPPANIGLRVGEATTKDIVDDAIDVLLATGQGTPSLISDNAIIPALVRNGIPETDARSYAYGGCHWWQVPGRQFGLCDGTKINLLGLLRTALARLMKSYDEPSTEQLWNEFTNGVTESLRFAAEAYALDRRVSGRSFPELLQASFCHGPLEIGRDVRSGGVAYTTYIADGVGLANVIDSFAALHRVIDNEGHATYAQLWQALERDFQHEDDAPLLRALRAAPKFGSDTPAVTEIAKRVRSIYVQAAADAEPTDRSFRILPGFYSWVVNTMLAEMPATPDGRTSGTPLAHGANPATGYASPDPTAIARDIAAIQTGSGASSPLHLEMDPASFRKKDGRDALRLFVEACFTMSIPQITLNMISRSTLEHARRTPEANRHLNVRVTGFSAYYVDLFGGIQEEILQRYD